MAEGIQEELFWKSTPEELEAIFEVLHEGDRRATLRSALVAATIVNVNRRPGARMVRPEDFIRELPKPSDFMSVEQGVAAMDSWARVQNQEVQ